MLPFRHIYTFNYDDFQTDICQLEARTLFQKEAKDKMLFSNITVNPDHSAFIKKRFDILFSASTYEELIQEIQLEEIAVEEFKAEYLQLPGDQTGYKKQLACLKDIGYSIEGNPNYQNPSIIYSLCCFEGVWYFGILTKNSFDWHKHKAKPKSYSSSILISIAKTLVNIVSNSNPSTTILDACCGVGTVILEACYAGYHIEGCEINWKICQDAKENIQFFNYTAQVYRSDIQDISKRYDAAIIDLPYNISCNATEEDMLNIIGSAANISNRIAIVSNTDISNIIHSIQLNLLDYCEIGKKGRTDFSRKIWLCETQRASF